MNRNNFYKYLNNLERHTKSNHNGWNNDDATAKYEMFWSGVQGSMHLSSPKLHNDYSNDNYLYKKGNLLNPKQVLGHIFQHILYTNDFYFRHTYSMLMEL